jgi:ketosteroid isomerase-like protein
MKHTIVAVVAMVLLAPLAVAARQGKDERDLIQLVRDIQTATNRQDADALDKALADEFLNIHSTGILKAKVEWLADLRGGRTKFQNEEPDDFKVRVHQDTAVVHYRIRGKGQAAGKPQGGLFRATRIFVRRDGRWQCVAAHWTNVPEAASP